MDPVLSVSVGMVIRFQGELRRVITVSPCTGMVRLGWVLRDSYSYINYRPDGCLQEWFKLSDVGPAAEPAEPLKTWPWPEGLARKV